MSANLQKTGAKRKFWAVNFKTTQKQAQVKFAYTNIFGRKLNLDPLAKLIFISLIEAVCQ